MIKFFKRLFKKKEKQNFKEEVKTIRDGYDKLHDNNLWNDGSSFNTKMYYNKKIIK